MRDNNLQTNQGNIQNLAELRQIMNANLKFNQISLYPILHHSNFMWNDRK